MVLRIDGNTRLVDIQTAFTGKFPYLKLEFSRQPYEPQRDTAKKEMRSGGELALSSDKRDMIADVLFDSNWKVCEVEEFLLEKAGLFAQVLRRSGNLWIGTSLTEDWTLEQQNKEGELFSTVLSQDLLNQPSNKKI